MMRGGDERIDGAEGNVKEGDLRSCGKEGNDRCVFPCLDGKEDLESSAGWQRTCSRWDLDRSSN
jgi:hypothetical protein